MSDTPPMAPPAPEPVPPQDWIVDNGGPVEGFDGAILADDAVVIVATRYGCAMAPVEMTVAELIDRRKTRDAPIKYRPA